MNHGLSANLQRLRRTGLVAVSVTVATFQTFGWLGLRINLSTSLPAGLYITSEEGHLVEFCPCEPFGDLAIRRGYRGRGVCADGGEPLLKPVVAVAGDEVSLSSAGLSVNGVLIPNTTPLRADSKGRGLEPRPYGRYRVAPGMIWVASAYNARSFDSRYFGPIPVTAVRHRVKPLLTL